MKPPDVLEGNCARPVLPGLFYMPSLKEFLLGGFASMVGQSFLLAGSSPKADGLASVAIWANCWVGDDDGNRPTSSSCLASSTHLLASSNVCSTSLMGEGFLTGEGWCTGEGGPFDSFLFSSSLTLLAFLFSPHAFSTIWALSALVLNTVFHSLSFFGVTLVLAILCKNKKRRL